MFGATAWLWAMGLAAVPLAIYLLFRRKRRDVPWGAGYILRKVVESRSRRAMWLQYLVIALRTLACLAVVGLFAEAMWPRGAEGGAGFPPSPPSTHRVVILDVSESMMARCEGGTALEAAVDVARRAIRATGRPGRVDLVRGDGAECVELRDVDAGLAEAVESRVALNPVAALRRAEQVLAASVYHRQEVIWLSDFCARDFPAEVLSEVEERLARLKARGVRVYALALRSAQTGNAVIYDCAPLEAVVGANVPTLLRARIGYFGTEKAGQTTLTVTDENGTELYAQTLSLLLGEQEFLFPVSLDAGTHRITATLSPDALDADNVCVRTVRVLSQYSIILVQNITMNPGFENPRTWLDLAMKSTSNAMAGGGDAPRPTSTAEAFSQHSQAVSEAAQKGKEASTAPFAVSIEGKIPEQLNADLLRLANMVILLDIDTLSLEAQEVVRRYVLRGGTVLLAPGPLAKADYFNETFAALSPADIGEPFFEAINPEVYEQCVLEAGDDPFFRELEQPHQGNIGAPRFYNWRTVNNAAGGSSALLDVGSSMFDVRRSRDASVTSNIERRTSKRRRARNSVERRMSTVWPEGMDWWWLRGMQRVFQRRAR